MDPIDTFNIAALEIMHRCLERPFPIYADISPDDVAMKLEGYFKEPDTYEGHFEQIANLRDVAEYTIQWLIDEEFLTAKHKTMQAYRVTLSLKGLNAINSTPLATDAKQTAKSVVSNGLVGVGASVISGVMIELFKRGTS